MFFKIQNKFYKWRTDRNESKKITLVDSLQNSLADSHHISKEIAMSSVRIQDVINYLKSNSSQIDIQYRSIHQDSLEAALNDNSLLLNQLIEDELQLKYTQKVYLHRVEELSILLDYLKEGVHEIDDLIRRQEDRILYLTSNNFNSLPTEDIQESLINSEKNHKQIWDIISHANKLLSKYQQIPTFNQKNLKIEDIEAKKQSIYLELKENHNLVAHITALKSSKDKKSKRSEALTQKEKSAMFNEFLNDPFSSNETNINHEKVNKVLDAFLNSTPIQTYNHRKRG
ncbi:hypothetical protein [Sediminitomix flava]|uniref:Uncharacterized protein n=1 Tax=Sediminitomix flava TaxID=379075 RepID=A0A315Z7W6_SEDFL|nr:hypothetical protein [Sediminitomix flava]PWJ40015.1 hypothetical protein BC781_10578 [Sediminitomix flava]